MNPDVQSIAQMAQHLQQSTHHHDSPDSPNTPKRKADDDGHGNGGPPTQRARRNRYVTIACNECKRRKIKCNGQTPCQRCGNLNLECVYAPNCCSSFKDSPEYRDMSAQIAVLQDQVADLYANLSAMREQFGNTGSQPPIDPSLQGGGGFSGSGIQPPPVPVTSMSPSLSRPKSQPHSAQPTYRGPTSAAFGFGVASNSLQTMGIVSNSGSTGSGAGGGYERGEDPRMNDVSPAKTPPPFERVRSGQVYADMHRDKDPIWSIPKEEAIRLCRVYEDELGAMYPILNIDSVIAYAEKLYRFMDAAKRTGLMQQGFPGADSIDDEDTNILKMVLATAMTVEASGRSETGKAIFDYVQPLIDRMLLGSVGIKGIRLLTLAAMYGFHRDDEATSWRIIGLTARVCIELGLHRRETYDAIKDEEERTGAVLLFWAIYVLDRRWSFGTGMPFALQDADIDPQLPKPGDASPYLSVMIQYSVIGSKVWRNVSSSITNNTSPDAAEMDYLDYQVIQWLRNIPPQLRYDHPSQPSKTPAAGEPPVSRAEHRLQILVYLRANAMRIHNYRRVLHTATSIMQHREQARTVVDVAKDTIRVLTHTNMTSDLYRTQQVLFNAFLTTALAVLFLAVSHAPAIFAESVREEFYMALNLVRGFSKDSWVSKRLWRTIRVLKDFGPQLGLANKENTSNTTSTTNGHTGSHPNHTSNAGNAAKEADFDQNSRSAAVAMAGLAGHNVDELALYNGQHAANAWPPGPSGSPENMVHDLTSLFEAAGGYQALADANGGGGSGSSDGGFAGQVGSNIQGNDDGLNHILKDLF